MASGGGAVTDSADASAQLRSKMTVAAASERADAGLGGARYMVYKLCKVYTIGFASLHGPSGRTHEPACGYAFYARAS